MASKPARRFATRALGALVALAGLAIPGVALAIKWNLQPPASPIAADIHSLHEYVMLLVTVIFVGVFAFMFWAAYAHRKSKGHQAAQFHENTTVEILWTVIPALILIVIAWPTTRVVIAQKDTSNADLTIKATGLQWKWAYDYVKGEGEGISFVSSLATPRDQIEGREAKDEHYLLEVDHELVVPMGKKVRILTTAADVIHSWWVPAFGVKQDAIPGFIRDTWFKADKLGTFRGQCAELCGKEHGFMPIVVKVVSQEDYAKWVAAEKQKMAGAQQDASKVWTEAELAQHGEKVFAGTCAACHQPNGAGLPKVFPSLVGSKVVLGPKEEQIKLVLNGRKGVFQPNTMMPPQAALSDVDIAAAITYTRNSWGNKAQENVVQPSEVKALRK
ncbi:MAG TPA: cytochrome c oxidase subunit II [Burkholderiales bacterium]|nr:cytochrome c oxidase subunit II [Burkholderiales bacterium]